METTKVNEPRLRKLAERLVSRECKEIFYMMDACCNSNQEVAVERSALPALEAAISESANVFPDDWYWDLENEVAYYKDDSEMNPSSSAMLFYGLDPITFRHLFVPFNQYPAIFGGTMLEIIITPTHIGDNIFEFLERYKANMN